MNGSVGYSQEALRRLETGTYRGRKQQYRTSEDQVKAIPKPLPKLEGMTRSPSFNEQQGVDTQSARRNYERRIGHVSPDVEARNLRSRGYSPSYRQINFSNTDELLDIALEQRENERKRNEQERSVAEGSPAQKFYRWRDSFLEPSEESKIAERQYYIDKYGASKDDVLDAYAAYKEGVERKKREDSPFLSGLPDFGSAFQRGVESAGSWLGKQFEGSDLDKMLNSDTALAKTKEVEKKRDYSRNSSKISDAKKNTLESYYDFGDLLAGSAEGGALTGGFGVYNPATGNGMSFEPSKLLKGLGKVVPAYGNAATNAYGRLQRQGVDEDKASQLANVEGLIRAAQTAIPGAKGASILGAGGIEALKGVSAQGIRELAEGLILENNSAYNAGVNAYKAQGLSDEDAKTSAGRDLLTRLGFAGVAGFLFGAGGKLLSNGIPKLASKASESYDPYSDLNTVYQQALPQNDIPLLTGTANDTQALTGNTYNEVPALVDNIYPIQMPGSNGVINLPGETVPIQLPDLAAKSAPVVKNAVKTVAESRGQNPRLVIPLEGDALKQANVDKANINKRIKALNNSIKIQEEVAKTGKNKSIRAAETKKLNAMKSELAELKQQKTSIDRQIKGQPTPIIEQLTPEEVAKVNAFKAQVRKVGNMWAGDQGKELAKRVNAALDKYIETGSQEDLREYAMELVQLENSATEPYTSKAGNTSHYSDYNDEYALFDAGMSGLDPIFEKSRKMNQTGFYAPEADAIDEAEGLIGNNTRQPSELRPSNTDPAHDVAWRYADAFSNIDDYGYLDMGEGEVESVVEQMADDIMKGRDLTPYIAGLEDSIDNAPNAEVAAQMQGLIDELNALQNGSDNALSSAERAALQNNEGLYPEEIAAKALEDTYDNTAIKTTNSMLNYELDRFSNNPPINFIPGEYKQALNDGTMTRDEVLSQTTPEFQNVYNRLSANKYVDMDEILDVPEMIYVLENMKPGSSLKDYGERPELWQALADKYYNENGSAIIDSNGNANYNGNVNNDGLVVFVTGYSGSGKSTSVVDPLSQQLKARVLDIDAIKEIHPDNPTGLNDSYVHDECREILSRVTEKAVRNRENIIVPIIGGEETKDLEDRIKLILGNKLKDYEIGIVYNDLPKHKAVGRILSRIVTKGRYTPPHLPYAVHVEPLDNYTRLVKGGRNNGINISGFAHVDNDVAEGSPRPVESGGFLKDFFGEKGSTAENGERTVETLSGTNGQGTGLSDVNNDNTGYWLRILGDEDFLLQQSQQQNIDPTVLQEWAYKNLGFAPSVSNTTTPPPANNVPHMNGTIPGDGGKTSQAYTNTGKYGGGWSQKQYDQYTDPSQFQYENVDEQESVNRAIDMLRKEGREGFKNRMMQAQKASGAEIDGMMMEWRQLAAEARALEEAGEDASAKISESIRVFRKIQQLSTESAQGLQALAKWSRNTPEGMLSRAEHIANGRINKDGTDKSAVQKTLEKAAKNKKNFQFDDDFIHDFLAEAEKVLELPADSREAEIEMAKLGKMVSSQIPVSLGEKVTAFLMNNMLGNFRTLISRNAGGNVGLNAIEQLIQRPLAAGIDSIVSRKTGVRTQAGLSRDGLLDYLHGFAKGIKEEGQDFKLDLHTARSGENTLERAISANRRVFKNRLMNFGDKLVKTGLSLGDRPFYEGVYNQTIGDYYRLRNSGKMGDVIQSLSDDDFEMFANAAAQINALAAVYQKDSQLSNALMGIKNSVGELSRGLVGVDILSQFSMPFVKTPAGVVDVAIDYSPLGLVRNAIKTGREIHNENFDQNRFANETARNILGTVGMAGAVGAAAAGAMSGGFSDDKDEKQAQKDAGMQEYALNLGDKQMDIGWSPVTGSNAVAAAAFYDEYKKDPEHPIEGLVKGTAKGGKALLDQAVFQGMQRLFGGDSYNSENGIIGNIGETIKSGFGQGIPALVRQAAQVTDPYKRDLANSNKDWNVLGFDNYDINSLVNNVPVLREMLLAPQVDNSGELVRESQGRNIASKFMEDMILPGKISKFEYNRLNEEAARLKEATTSRDAYMPKASRDNVDTEDHTLTNKEWTDFQQKYYKEMTMAGNKTLNSDFYKNSNAAKQVEILKGVYNAIRYANQAVYNGKELDGAAKKYAEAGGGSKGVDAVVKYYQQGDEAEKLGVNATTYRKKEAENPGSGKEYAETKKKADALGLTVDTYNSKEKQSPGGATKYAQTKKSADELGIKPEQYEKVSKAAGNRANEVLNKLPELKRNGITGTNAFLTYEQASRMIPNLTTRDFVKTFNAIDKDNSKGLKQGEVLDYLNANYKNASESEVQKIYDTYILEENRTNDAKQKKIVYKADGVWKDKYPKK